MTVRKPAASTRKAPAPRKAAAPAKKATAKKATTPRKLAAPRKTAPRAAALRVVKAGEKPPVVEPGKVAQLSIVEAAEANDERALLVALRLKIARTLQDSSTPAKDQASLSIRLMQINRDIQAHDARAKEDAADAGEVEDEAFDPEAL